MNIVDLLFGTYWPQVTLILLGIGYFIKRLFDQKAKQREIKYQLFQENKIKAIHDFLDSYTEVGKAFIKYDIYDLIHRNKTEEEMDDLVHGPLENMKRCVAYLRIYLEPSQHKPFENAVRCLLVINMSASSAYKEFLLQGESAAKPAINKYNSVKHKKLSEAYNHIKSISEEIRAGYLR